MGGVSGGWGEGAEDGGSERRVGGVSGGWGE